MADDFRAFVEFDYDCGGLGWYTRRQRIATNEQTTAKEQIRPLLFQEMADIKRLGYALVTKTDGVTLQAITDKEIRKVEAKLVYE